MKGYKTAQEVAQLVKSKMTIMVGGFLGVGSPLSFLDEIAKSDCSNLILISSDTCYKDQGNGKLIAANKISKLYASHIGTNPQTGEQYSRGTLQVEFVPQGTLAERIRAGGAGLGGILTPTGIGTIVEEGKQKIQVDGREFLLETPLRADLALIKAYKADKFGNLIFRKSMRNFNPLMLTAADIVCVEVDYVVDELEPDQIHSPGIYVDYISLVRRHELIKLETSCSENK